MRRKAADTRELQDRVGHPFADASLLEQALTHSSALAGGSRVNSYQRLEFLGDRVLGLAISDMLLREFPRASEGELSRRLAGLVRAETCAAVARAMQLDAVIQLGKTKGARARLTQTILADVCEAIVGAVFLDGGYAAAAGMVERFWQEHMRTPPRPLRDAKTVLQEWAQARGLPTPAYREVDRTGPHHNPQFRIAVELPERVPAEGSGRTKRAAEQAAASAMLEREGVTLDDAHD
ncbi:MAG TPA: ribonuclease III [Xanthobacteraceae bacterium]|nr:ribonuclease III [Xanthobacteraceae bacterium]